MTQSRAEPSRDEAATAEHRSPGAPGIVRRTGRATLAMAADVGGMATIVGRSLAALLPPRIEWHGLLRGMYRFGYQSIPLVVATAFLTGVVVLLMAAVHVRQYGATGIVGWATGYTTFRELGPVLIALMFSGRVGSHNTAELAVMKITDQIEALRALAIDVYAYLIIPRIFAMLIVLVALTLIGNLLAIVGAAIAADSLVNVSYAVFLDSFTSYVKLADLCHGLLKAAVFGVAIAVISCHYGLSARGGAAAVGKAVNSSVVNSAVAIFLLDYLITHALT